MKSKSGERTLLASVLMSLPGPLVVGAALFVGRSSTQLADFIRRTAELVTLVVSWLVFRIVQNLDGNNIKSKVKLEQIANTCVGATMCLSGPIILFVALTSSNTGKGNVIPGLTIAVLGVIANSWFWLRYRKLNQENPNTIYAVQSKLYRAKAFVDICVAIALATVAIAPGAKITQYIDLVGSIIVSIYLISNGIITIRGANSKEIGTKII